MKRFATHDFEDLLQVGVSCSFFPFRVSWAYIFVQIVLARCGSVPYLYLMVCLMARIIVTSFSCFSYLLTGMGLRSFVCILIRRWHYLMKLPFFSESSSDVLLITPVGSLTPANFNVKLTPVPAELQRSQIPLQSGCTRNARCGSTYFDGGAGDKPWKPSTLYHICLCTRNAANNCRSFYWTSEGDGQRLPCIFSACRN